MTPDNPLFMTRIVQLEWYTAAATEAEREFRLINRGILPKVLWGQFTVTMCLRLLRAVFGTQSDSEAVDQLRRYVEDAGKYWKQQVYLDDGKN